MRTSINGVRWLVMLAAAGGGAGLATACSQIIGADFDVKLASTSAGGAGGDAGPGTGSAGLGGGGGAGGASTCDVNPCPAETVAADQDYPWGLVVQGDSVYWTVAGASLGADPPKNDGAIRRASVNGGDVETVLGQLQAPNQIASDGEYLYWTSTISAPGGGVYRCLISGCVKETVAPTQGFPTGVTVGGAYVYWSATGDGAIRRRLRDQQADGGAGIDTAMGSFDHPNLVVQDVDAVYFAEFSPTGEVWRLGGDLSATPITQPLNTPTGLVVHGGDICYTTFNPMGLVQCVDKVSHEASFTAAIEQPYPAGLATDGTALYWANGTLDGQIMRRGPGDQGPIAIASNQPSPNGVVVAGKWVYWTNHRLGGSVMRTLKD
jgi:hypothetical protein